MDFTHCHNRHILLVLLAMLLLSACLLYIPSTAFAEDALAGSDSNQYSLTISNPDPSTGFSDTTCTSLGQSTVKYTVTNTGTSDLTGLKATIANNSTVAKFTTNWSSSSTIPKTLASGKTCSIYVRTYRPGVSPVSAGTYTGSLTIDTAEGASASQMLSVNIVKDQNSSSDIIMYANVTNTSAPGKSDGSISSLNMYKITEYKAPESAPFTALPAGTTEIS